jgi:glycosyltransferase involved in cell wall biosynthesis
MSSNQSHLVSVVVAAYNYGRFIPQTIDSLIAQTYTNWECIVVDDGSTDNSQAVVHTFVEKDARVHYLRQKNEKQAVARNTGIRHSAGEYLQFLDADDLIEPKKLEHQVKYLKEHSDVDIVYSGVRYFDEQVSDELAQSRRYSVWDDGKPWMPEISGRGEVVLEKLLRNNIMVVNSPLFKRSVVQEVGEFAPDLTPVEDWDYLTRCALAGFQFDYEDGEGIRALVRAHESSASLDGRRMMRATLKMRRAWATKTLTERHHRRVNEQLIAECEGLLGVEEVMHGNRFQGALKILKAATLDRNMRHRAKWLACALLAPFATGEQLRNAVTNSFTGSAASVLRRREANARR